MISYVDNIKLNDIHISLHDMQLYHKNVIIKQATLSEFNALIKENYYKPARTIYEYINTDNVRMHLCISYIQDHYKYTQEDIYYDTIIELFEECFNIHDYIHVQHNVSDNYPDEYHNACSCMIYCPYIINKCDMYIMQRLFEKTLNTCMGECHIELVQYNEQGLYNTPTSRILNNRLSSINDMIIQNTYNLKIYVKPLQFKYVTDDDAYHAYCQYYECHPNEEQIKYIHINDNKCNVADKQVFDVDHDSSSDIEILDANEITEINTINSDEQNQESLINLDNTDILINKILQMSDLIKNYKINEYESTINKQQRIITKMTNIIYIFLFFFLIILMNVLMQ